MKQKLICHICGKEKKPYTVFMNTDVLSLIKYQTAREDGEICQRCNSYYAMTGEFKDATKQEFENAEKAVWFANMMLEWWEKDKKLDCDDSNGNKRQWEGTETSAKWCRDILNKRGE